MSSSANEAAIKLNVHVTSYSVAISFSALTFPSARKLNFYVLVIHGADVAEVVVYMLCLFRFDFKHGMLVK